MNIRNSLLCLCLLFPATAPLWFSGPARADGTPPVAEFTATYDVKVNGVGVAEAEFSLVRIDNEQYLYRQSSESTGVASIFGSDRASETSRWRLNGSHIQVLEYQGKRSKGDDDDNAHLFFDWDHLQVENRGAGKPWKIAMPEGTLDKMLMQLAILFDLRDGATILEYPVAVRGRIKRYRFEVIGEDRTELEIGTFETLKLERRDDSKDKSWIWSAPDLEYLPVRFLKHKKSGVKIETRLRDVRFRDSGN